MKYFLFLSLLTSSLLGIGQVEYTMNVSTGGGVSGYYGDLGSDFSYERFTFDVGVSFEVRKRNWAFILGSGFTDIGHLAYFAFRDQNGGDAGGVDLTFNRSGAYVHAGFRYYPRRSKFFYGGGVQNTFIRQLKVRSSIFTEDHTYDPFLNHVMTYGEVGYRVELSRHFSISAVLKQTVGVYTFVPNQVNMTGNPVQSIISGEFCYRFR
ncbi:MAG: hypothetical protein HWD92_02850 [Flavobacteriia bacterium]|nr:hypothetical protein [Flavobacteriia bacterium]